MQLRGQYIPNILTYITFLFSFSPSENVVKFFVVYFQVWDFRGNQYETANASGQTFFKTKQNEILECND